MSFYTISNTGSSPYSSFSTVANSANSATSEMLRQLDTAGLTQVTPDILDISEAGKTISVDLSSLSSKFGNINDKKSLEFEAVRLDAKIDEILKSSGIELKATESLNFKVDQDGEIKITGGIKDKKQIEKIEKALNADSTLGDELLYHTAKSAELNGRLNDKYRSILDIAPVNGVTEDLPSEYSVEFTHRNGVTMERSEFDRLKKMQNVDAEGNKMSRQDVITFGTSMSGEADMARYQKMAFGNDSYQKLAQLTGLSGSVNDKDTLLRGLSQLIQDETNAIQDELNAAVAKKEIDLGNRRVTFSLNSTGEVTVGGIKDGTKIAKLNKILDESGDLAERMRSLDAKTQLLDQVVQFDGIDLSNEENVALRGELLRSYLRENGNLDLESLEVKTDPETGRSFVALPAGTDPEFAELLAGSDWLAQEIIDVKATENISPEKTVAGMKAKLESKAGADTKAEETKSLFWYKNGSLSEAINAEPIDMGQAKAQAFSELVNYYDESGTQLTLSQAISHYNSRLSDSPELQIRDFKLVITDKTRGMNEEAGSYAISIEDVVAGDGSTSGDNVASLQRIIGSWLDTDFRETASGVGKAVLENHDIQHGDVADYTHDVAFSLSGRSLVRSEEADLAALADIQTKTQELQVELGSYFRDTFINANRNLGKDELTSILSNPADISIDENGTISLDTTNLDVRLAAMIQQTFSMLNERVLSDDPFGDNFAEKLPESLSRSLELLCGIRDDIDRIHDPELKKQVGFTLDFSGGDR